MFAMRRLAIVIGAVIVTFAGWQTTVAAAHSRPEAGLYNAAQRAFANGDIRGGVDLLSRAVAISPGNSNILALRALWAAQLSDIIARDDSLARLGAVDPGRGALVVRALDAINAAVPVPPDPFPSLQGPGTAIVVLGYGLAPDGRMRPELLDRLQAAWIQAIAAPLSPIITTGGNPQNGLTEGEAMAGWLIAHGIPAFRIHPETDAGSTVQNAQFSAGIIRAAGASSAVLVTSANHIRRSTADFLIAGVPIIGAMTPVNHWASQLLPPTWTEQRGMYRDASKLLGLPESL